MEKITAKISGLEIKRGIRGDNGFFQFNAREVRTGRGPGVRWPTHWEKASHQELQVLLGVQGQGGTSVHRRQENNWE